MVMPSLKTGHDAARRRFWLAMLGLIMRLRCCPFPGESNAASRRRFTSKAQSPKRVDQDLAQAFPVLLTPTGLILVISGVPDVDSAKGADTLTFLDQFLA